MSEMRDLSEDTADAVWLESGLAELDLFGPPSALLALPGELRNRIYDFCTEPGYRHITQKRISDTRRRRPFIALTQVCKQLRKEFRPLYMKRTSVVVSVDWVDRYLDDLYPAESNDERACWEGDIIVTLAYASVDGDILQFDMTLMLVFLLHSPKVRCRFTPLNDLFTFLKGPAAELSELVACIPHNVLWVTVLSDALYRLKLVIGVGSATLHFDFLEDLIGGKNWSWEHDVATIKNSCGQIYSEVDMNKWLERVGLPQMEYFYISLMMVTLWGEEDLNLDEEEEFRDTSMLSIRRSLKNAGIPFGGAYD